MNLSKNKNLHQKIENDTKNIPLVNVEGLLYICTIFYKNQYNCTLGFSWFLGNIVLNLFLFFPIFFLLIFDNTLMIYNTRNLCNDTTESEKKKNLMLIFSTVSEKSRD